MTRSVPAPTPELSASLHRLLQLAREALPFDWAAVHLLNNLELETCARFMLPGPGEGGAPASLSTLNRALAEQVARQQRSLLRAAVAVRPEGIRLPEGVEAGREVAFLGLPLCQEEVLLGVLELVAFEPGAFGPPHLERALIVGEQATGLLSQAQLQQERQRLQKQQQVLQKLARALGATLDLRGVLDIVLEQLYELLPYDSASISLLDGAALEFMAVRGSNGPEEGARFPLDELQLSRQVIETREPLLISDALDGTVRRSPRFNPHRSWLGVPLIAHDRVIGALSLDRSAAAAYSWEDVQSVVACADHAALAIQNARLYRDARQLRDYYQQVVDSVEQAIFTTDFTGRQTGMNARWRALVQPEPPQGAPRAALIERSLSEVVGRDAYVTFERLLGEIRGGETRASAEMRWSTPEGLLHFQIEATPLARDGDEVEGVTFRLTDVTAQRQLEGQLQEHNKALLTSNDQLEALLDATESGIILSDGAGQIVHVNSVLCEMVAKGRDTLLGRSILEVMDEVAGRFSNPQAFQRRTEWLYEHDRAVVRDSLATAGSEPRLFQRYSAPVYARGRADGDAPGRIEVYSDVTESRRLEARMRQYLDEMMTVHRIGVAMGTEQESETLLHLVCAQAGGLVEGSAAAVALLLESDPEVLVIPVTHGLPAEVEGRQEYVYHSTVGQAILQRRPVRLSAGRVQETWGMASMVAVPLESRDQVIGALMVFQKEERHFDDHAVQLLQIFASQAAVTIENTRLLTMAQNRRKELEAVTEYNDLLIESSPVGIAVLGMDGRFVRANPAFAAVVAPEGTPIEGAELETIFPQAEEADLLRLIQQALREGVAQHVNDFYYPYLRRGPVWLDLSFSPLHERDGGDRGVMMTLTDISGRKQLEADLRQRNERINRQLARHRALYETGTQINAELELTKVLDKLLASIQLIFAADGLTLMMRHEPGEPGDAFAPASALGLSESFLATERARFEGGAAGLAVEQRAPVLISHIGEDARMSGMREEARAEGLHTALFIPFIYRDEVVALMALYHRRPYRYSLEEMELLAIFANQATAAIKNAQFYDSIIQSQNNLNAILQSMTDGVIALDQQDRVIFVNQPLFELLGLEPGTQWIGKRSSDLWPDFQQRLKGIPGGLPITSTLVESEGVVAVEVETREPSRTIEMVYAPILNESGGNEGRLILLHDITQLRASERMKDELISVLSHELRTPLTSILGYSKLLVDRPDATAEKRGRWASHILNKSRLLNRLVNEVLDLSRLNMQRFDVDVRPADLAALVQRVAAEQQPLAGECTITLRLGPNLSEVPMDLERMEQLLVNLLLNAIKYSPDGGTIEIRARQEEQEVWLEVEDQGIGIAADHQERIFEPFFRVDNSTTRDVYGTGLGLPLCRGIARAHGGEISVRSEPGQGTLFSVRMPLAPPLSIA